MDAKRDDQDDDNAEGFLRRSTWAEEDRHLYTSMPWRGERRWFRSPNVVTLENYRRAAARKEEEKRP